MVMYLFVNQDYQTPLKLLADSPMKYLRILEEFKKTSKQYTDETFVANNGILSDDMSSEKPKWRRPNPTAVLFKDTISPLDIRQGYIGDCYLMSAISVIGEKRVEDLFLWKDTSFDQAAKTKCGAYILRFWINSSWIHVIIDDILPYVDDKLLLGQAEDTNELWPAMIEKAYAKIYGSYKDIEGGKVSYVLQELTGGLPEEITLDKFHDNVSVLWSSLLDYMRYGYILGAGSPAHEKGDKAISTEGIVFGHAYAVLDCKDVDGNKLLCIRNPHGNHGTEWSGDWSDKSPKWNARLMKLAGEQTFSEDGKFWMSVNDFVYEYRAIYLCRLFQPDIWQAVPIIKGAWVGAKAAGLPTKKNMNVKIEKNPHYGIKVSQKCEAFIFLTIEKTTDRMTGQYPIYFIVQKNGGKRVNRMSGDLLAGGCKGLTQLKSTSCSITLDAPSYPYTFSLMCSTMYEGEESPFNLQIYCTDKTISIIDDAQFQ